MKHVRSGISYCALIALMLGVLAPMGMMPASAQDLAATPVGDEPSNSVITGGETDLVENDGIEQESANGDDPTNESGNLQLPTDVEWVVFGQYPAVGDPSITPGATIGYYADITNHGGVALNYKIEMTLSGPASISVFSTTSYNCETSGETTTCTATSALQNAATRSFIYSVDVDYFPGATTCASPIALTTKVTFSNNYSESYNDSWSLNCNAQPHLAIEPIVLDSANQEKLGDAEVGDRLVLEVTLTNPHASTLTIGQFSTFSDTELHVLSWTPGPTDAFAAEGPCVIDQNGQVSCSNITLAPSGQEGSVLTITLTSDPLTKSGMLCGQFSMSAAVTGGPSSGLANFDIACTPPLATLPQINLGTATCVGTTAMVPMTLSGGQHIQTPVISQNATTITPDGTGVYQIQSGVATSVIFTVPTEAEWPDPLPILFESGQWIESATQPTFRFTPAELDCAPKLQITKTNSDPSNPALSAGSKFVFRVEVTNVGISTITGLHYSDYVAAELQWQSDGQLSHSMVYSEGQTCNVNAGDVMQGGKIIGTRFTGPTCQLLPGYQLQPGASVWFLYPAQVPWPIANEQCSNGISDPAQITSVNGVSTTIQSNNFKPRMLCGSFVPLQTVTLELSDNSSLEGATWKLYAPVASQADLPIYDQGVVGAGNLITFNKETPDGQYRLVIEPEGLPVIDRVLDIRADQTNIVLQVDVDPDDETPVVSPSPSPSPTATASATPSPTAESTASATSGSVEAGPVTGLPETGSGDGSGSTSLVVAIGTLLMVVAIVAGIRRSEEVSR